MSATHEKKSLEVEKVDEAELERIRDELISEVDRLRALLDSGHSVVGVGEGEEVGTPDGPHRASLVQEAANHRVAAGA